MNLTLIFFCKLFPHVMKWWPLSHANSNKRKGLTKGPILDELLESPKKARIKIEKKNLKCPRHFIGWFCNSRFIIGLEQKDISRHRQDSFDYWLSNRLLCTNWIQWKFTAKIFPHLCHISLINKMLHAFDGNILNPNFIPLACWEDIFQKWPFLEFYQKLPKMLIVVWKSKNWHILLVFSLHYAFKEKLLYHKISKLPKQ